MGVLDGVRVLDFGRYIAGPYCAALLAELGADVIRIERVGGGEDRAVAPLTAAGDGALYLQMARNKRALTLEPGTPQGREVVRRLVATAQVVVANLPPAALAAIGLDYDALRAIKPDIILTTTSAFGTRGPWAERVGFDGVGQAMTGAPHMTGSPDEPMRAAVAYVDFGTALHSAYGTLAAIMEWKATGRGRHVQTSLLGTALTMNNALLIEQAVLEPDRVATGNRGQLSAPADIYRTTDGWIVVQAIGNPMFRRWARLMGEPERWLDDPRFADDKTRGDHGELISARMAAWCAERSTDACLAALEGARIPCGPVLSPRQALVHEQVQAGGFLQPTDFPGLPRPAPVAQVPLEFADAPRAPLRRAPTLGEHTDAILAELGYAPAEIAALRQQGVV
jgi:crotonobetainyl-CoA:carnitine CoA-transferase CaiB-like acyl-CoA transferase